MASTYHMVFRRGSWGVLERDKGAGKRGPPPNNVRMLQQRDIYLQVSNYCTADASLT